VSASGRLGLAVGIGSVVVAYLLYLTVRFHLWAVDILGFVPCWLDSAASRSAILCSMLASDDVTDVVSRSINPSR
jgi:hypothetical protein